jgi:hypothetical protein
MRGRKIWTVLATGALLCLVPLAPIDGSAAATPGRQHDVIAGSQFAGVWTATGKVLASRNDPAEPAGLTLRRTWLIINDPFCTSCLGWEREISGGFLTSVLRPGRDGWSTSQKIGLACDPRGSGVQTSEWALQMGASTITATETETVTGACSASMRLEWTAKRGPEATYAAAMVYSSLKGAEGEAGFVTRSTDIVGDESSTEVTQSGGSGGLQYITIRKGPDTGTASIILIKQKVFVKANVYGLENIMEFTPVAAAAEADRWIEITAGVTVPKTEQEFYQNAAATLTVLSAVDQIGLDGPLTLVPSLVVVGGKITLPVKMAATLSGGIHATCTLYLDAGDPPLPVEQVTTSTDAGATMKATDVFSSWGKAPVVVAPTASVPFDTAWLSGPVALS